MLVFVLLILCALQEELRFRLVKYILKYEHKCVHLVHNDRFSASSPICNRIYDMISKKKLNGNLNSLQSVANESFFSAPLTTYIYAFSYKKYIHKYMYI